MQKVFVAGHKGHVGSAICRRLGDDGIEPITAGRDELDLANQSSVDDWFRDNKIQQVYLAAAKVGGIHANDSHPAEFIHENLAIQTNVIHAAWKHGIEKLLFLGSSCVYPKMAPQPLTEDSLLTGPLEPTNEWYAIAKIAGLKMCQAYRKQYGFDAISAMPTNIYGPGDNFDLNSSHVLPALIRKFYEAKLAGSSSGAIWGSGKPCREFLFVDDLADASLFLMNLYSDAGIVNVGWGVDISILKLAMLIAEIVGYEGNIELDPSKPDGTPRKLLDVSRIAALGWSSGTSLRDGISTTYYWYREHLT